MRYIGNSMRINEFTLIFQTRANTKSKSINCIPEIKGSHLDLTQNKVKFRPQAAFSNTKFLPISNTVQRWHSTAPKHCLKRLGEVFTTRKGKFPGTGMLLDRGSLPASISMCYINSAEALRHTWRGWGELGRRRKGGEWEGKTSCCPNNTTAGVKPDQMFFFILFQSYLR